MREHGQRTSDGRRVWTLEPDREASLYVIDALADYRALADAFPQRWDHSPKNPSYSPNWNQIASTKPFDGIHITNGVVEAGRAQSPKEHPQFTGWDVESTLWLIARFTRYEFVGALGPRWELE